MVCLQHLDNVNSKGLLIDAVESRIRWSSSVLLVDVHAVT
jgi:hypothetical protein